MKSTQAFNLRVFVSKSNKPPPKRKILITKVSLERNLSFANFEVLFRRSDLSFIRLGQWSKNDSLFQCQMHNCRLQQLNAGNRA